MANILYQKLRQQYSLDGGATWNYVYNAYKVGDVIENPSNCTSFDSKQYRWVELPIAEGYTCDPTTYTKYTVEVEEVTYNGGLTWTRTGNQRKANVYEENSVDCGYSGSTSGDTSECDNETLSFDFEGDSLVYRMGEDMVTTYTANTSPYSVTLTELGIDHNKLEIYAIFSGTNITNLYSMPCAHNVKNANQLFYDCGLLQSVNLNNFITNNNATLSYMFARCKYLTTINLNNLVTSNVVEIASMFAGCESLTTLDLSSFDTSNVRSMGGMFFDCTSLTSLNLSSFDTSNVTGMGYMFYNCNSLTSLDVSNFNTSNVTDMDSMFYYCSGLTSLDLSNFDTSRVIEMYDMFACCTSLTSLDLSSFDTSNVTRMDDMFENCSGLTALNLNGWDMTNVVNNNFMFDGCTSLTSITMCNCNQTTIDKITSALTSAGLQNQVTIIT